ncbi:TonB-dependent receptor domain-containing protein [Zunongwangia sp. H14]|uniref:TonB-dependent receptor n=1 Tax=Zunongwangia sp. H14 TaxID=3240792 RepID=UPI0035625462
MKQIVTLLALIFFTTLPSLAQEGTTGSIVGKLTDKEMNGEALPFANVIIKGTSRGTTTDMDGLYVLDKLQPGTYTVEFSFVGYETLEVPNVEVVAGKVTEVNTGLGASAASLDEVVISTVSRRDSEVALLLEQKGAIQIKESIGAQELARKGVSDAESAVTKLAGVSKQEGVKNVFVRGLGDRYNSTTLNGLPLPSEDPEYKNIALEFFDSNIINSLSISKTFRPEIYGDMAGANIDIVSKELYGSEALQIGIGTGFNSLAVNRDFKTVDGASWFGYGTDNNSPITSLNNYDFQNSLAPNSRNTQINTQASFQAGKRFDIGENEFSALLIGSMDSKYAYQEGNTKVINAQGLPLRNLDFQKYLYNISQILMGNFNYEFNDNNLELNSFYIHNNSQSVGEYFGQSANISEEETDYAFIRRQQVNDNSIFVNQLHGNFKLSERLDLNAAVAYNMTRANEPDRRQNTFVYNGSNYRVAVGTPAYNLRFFSELEENEIAGHLNFNYKIGEIEDDGSTKGQINLGYDYKDTDRTFEFLQFNHDFGSPAPVDTNNPDLLFNDENLSNNTFRLTTNSGFGDDFNPLDPFFYEGEKTIHAGFADVVYNFNTKLTAILGMRYENVEQYVNWNTNLSSSADDLNVDPSTINKNYFLPSITGKYNFSENSILRVVGSKTYTFPQFKEVAPFVYEDVNFASYGNPDLQPSDNYNFDIKYEYYLSSSEILSLTGFYKKIIDPINRVQVNSAANQLSYINSGDEADVAGVEVEVRKDIFEVEGGENSTTNQELSFGLNASYLYSRQDLTDESTNFTNNEDQLEGAAPFLLNTDLTHNYNSENFALTSSVVLNYFSDRIYSLGVQQKGNIVETGIPTLDFIARSTFAEHWGINFKVQNILNPDFELTQEDINGNSQVINSFKKGATFSIGINYSL